MNAQIRDNEGSTRGCKTETRRPPVNGAMERARLFGAAGGGVFAVVALSAFVIAPGPPSGNGLIVAEYYSAHATAALWQTALVGLSTVLFIWFAETFAGQVSSGAVALAGAAVTAALYLVAVGCWEVLGETYGGTDVTNLPSESYGNAHVLYGAGAGAAHLANFTAAAYLGATATAILGTAGNWRWLGWLGLGLTVTRLISAVIVLASQSHWSDVVGQAAFVAFLVWVFATSLWLISALRPGPITLPAQSMVTYSETAQ